jgi:hypothetical protein
MVGVIAFTAAPPALAGTASLEYGATGFGAISLFTLLFVAASIGLFFERARRRTREDIPCNEREALRDEVWELKAAAAERAAGADAARLIALTANAFDEDRQAAEAAGIDEFLTKPVDLRPHSPRFTVRPAKLALKPESRWRRRQKTGEWRSRGLDVRRIAGRRRDVPIRA